MQRRTRVEFALFLAAILLGGASAALSPVSHAAEVGPRLPGIENDAAEESPPAAGNSDNSGGEAIQTPKAPEDLPPADGTLPTDTKPDADGDTTPLPDEKPMADEPPVAKEMPAAEEKPETEEKSAPDGDPALPDEAALMEVGDPMAAGIITLLQQEIAAGLKSRGVADKYLRWEAYTGSRLTSSSGRHTGSELTGNCRLSWYDRMMRRPLAAPAEAELFTRQLHRAAMGNHEGFARVLAIAAEKMDLPTRDVLAYPRVTTPQQALETVKTALVETQMTFAAAMAPLSKAEIQQLQTSLVPVMVTQNRVGHTLQDRGTGRRLCDIMEKIDRDALHACADMLVPLTDPELLEQLRLLPDDRQLAVEGVVGTVAAQIATPAGTILIGGRGPNVYHLDKLADVVCVIDLGGNDGYADGTTSLQRPVLVLIDLEGDDVYRSAKPGVQGAAVLGVSMLLDFDGNDKYQAQDMAQGSALAGVGILIDYAGSDMYQALRRAQGQALGGLGVLVDRQGHDTYRAAMWAQGFGGPLGFGLLDDLEGNDQYYCGGQWPDSYEETPGLEGWGQGVGAGLRQVASGGIGVILDGAGDDIYEFDYLSHGGGYWCAVGFARDFGGNDQRLITRQSYTSGNRTEPKFQRFGCGWGCHYSVGFCIDDKGDDVYEGTIMGTGMGWDCSAGFLMDFGGNDRYEATGGLTQGTGAQASLGVLFDYDGEDTYRGYGQGYAPPSISYHDLPGCGGNFSFCVDYGGEDKYGSGARNNSYIQRGAAGGFLIDRPRREPGERTASTTDR